MMVLNLGRYPLLLKNRSNLSARGKEKIREIFVHPVFPGPNDFFGDIAWPVAWLTSADECYFSTHLPDDFQTLLEAVVVILPDTTETIQWDWGVEIAGHGDAYNRIATSDVNVQQAVTAEVVTELSLRMPTAGAPTGLLPTAATLIPGDYFSVWFASDTDDIPVLGLRLKYIAE